TKNSSTPASEIIIAASAMTLSNKRTSSSLRTIKTHANSGTYQVNTALNNSFNEFNRVTDVKLEITVMRRKPTVAEASSRFARIVSTISMRARLEPATVTLNRAITARAMTRRTEIQGK